MSTSIYRTTYHRDGTVTVWDVYSQRWTRRSAARLVAEAGHNNSVLPTLSQRERDRIAQIAQQHPMISEEE